MTTYALDSDITSFILRRQDNVLKHFNRVVAEGHEICIPPYVYYEVQRYITLKNAAAQQRTFDKIHEKAGIDVIDRAVLDRAISIYADLTRRGRAISDSDILIAAFCLEHDYTLVTNNTEHFKFITGLSLVNWNI